MYVCEHVYAVPSEARKDLRSPGTGIMDSMSGHVGVESRTWVLSKSGMHF